MTSTCLSGFFLVFVAVFSVSPVVPGALAGGCSCPPLWTAFGDNCYRYFSTRGITWFDAEMFCRNFSVPCKETSSDIILGHLTSVHSQEEMEFLSALYDSVRYKKTTSNIWVWIGMHDKGNETVFEWTDGSPVDYNYWAPGQPELGVSNQDCVVFRLYDEFKWNDGRCPWDGPGAFICKLPKW